MVNSWSLLGSILNGTFDEDYPIVKKKSSKNVSEATKEDYQDFWEEDGFSVTGNPAPASPDFINVRSGFGGLGSEFYADAKKQKEKMPKEEQDKFIYESPDGGKTVTRRTPTSDKKEVIQGDYYKDIPWSGVEDNRDSDLDWIEKSGGFEWTPGSPWPPEVPDEPVRDGSDLPTVGVSTDMGVAFDSTYYGDYMADMDDMYSHHFNHYRKPVDDDFKYFKYNEHTMLDKAKNYIASTYGSHYTGDKGTQTLDLIEGIGDAEAFCRSNAIKYLSRFGKKDGKNETDILKAIHYCTLLYHFAGLHNDDSN